MPEKPGTSSGVGGSLKKNPRCGLSQVSLIYSVGHARLCWPFAGVCGPCLLDRLGRIWPVRAFRAFGLRAVALACRGLPVDTGGKRLVRWLLDPLAGRCAAGRGAAAAGLGLPLLLAGALALSGALASCLLAGCCAGGWRAVAAAAGWRGPGLRLRRAYGRGDVSPSVRASSRSGCFARCRGDVLRLRAGPAAAWPVRWLCPVRWPLPGAVRLSCGRWRLSVWLVRPC